jgi:hypothetical protein
LPNRAAASGVEPLKLSLYLCSSVFIRFYLCPNFFSPEHAIAPMGGKKKGRPGAAFRGDAGEVDQKLTWARR